MAGTTEWDVPMQRAFEAALHGPARGVNPQVGCVLLNSNGDVLAVGHHRGAGTPHAEVDALSQVAPDFLHGATAVVSLEPCNHTGRTGPCAQALIEAGIARVVYAVTDPGDASSNGAQRLRDAGVEVVSGIRAADGEALLGSWLIAARLGRPWTIVKWAQSLDGRAAANDGSSQWISSVESRADVHLERSLADGIAVGSGTVLADDPALSARNGDTLYEDQPIPVVFGRRSVPETARLRGARHAFIQLDGVDLAADLATLPGRGIRTLFVEGGPSLVSSLLRLGLVDELLVYQAPLLLGGARRAIEDLGIPTLADAHRWHYSDVSALGSDLKLRLRKG